VGDSTTTKGLLTVTPRLDSDYRILIIQIKFLDCFSRPPSTTYYLYAVLKGAPSILAKNII